MAGPNTRVGVLQYTGVQAPNPPNFITANRAPTTNDWQNYSLGCLWENTNRNSATFKNVWILVSIAGNDGMTKHTAIWSLISSGSAGVGASVLGVSNVTNNLSSAGATTYVPPYGGLSTVQTQSQMVMPTGGIITNLYVQIYTNGSTTNGSITLNVNGVNSALTVAIPLGTTGLFSNLVNSVTVLQGDLIQFESAQTTVGILTGNISALLNI